MLKPEHEIRDKVEELRLSRFEHGKTCQIPIDKCEIALELDPLIHALEWVLES